MMQQNLNERGSGERAEIDQETAKRVVEGWTGPAAGWKDFLAADVIYTSPIHGRLVGRDMVLAAMGRVDESLGGLRREVRDVIVDGPFIALRYLAVGTHDREYRGIPPTGREIDTHGIVIFRMHDGQAVEGWNILDQHGRLSRMRADADVDVATRTPGAATTPEIDAECPPPARSEMDKLVRDFFTRVWTSHPAPGGVLAENVVFHPTLGTSVTGVADVIDVNAGWWTAFPDMRQRRGEILVSGDLAATWYAATGTDTGGFAG
ncbi:MAG: ester cyclase, partial [Thermomicrobiales bacterium]